MNPNREESLFLEAACLQGAEREAFLNGACHGNPGLRRRLDDLLAVHERTDSFLEPEEEVLVGRQFLSTVKVEPAQNSAAEMVGQTIGRYKLLEELGEGGCGVVYVAEQTEPVRRRVALKVIKLGMDTKAVVARFEAERQALAMMDHPNIAKVLDAGTTAQGRPYFVMELVRGIRVTEYCDQANLSTQQRLELFIQVCNAIQHAHQKGIIHRDIKPSNILVTLHDGVPVPKVIDFGIAKATEGRLTDQTVYTQLNQFIGTPAYMSPEQAEMSGLDIDTRSDIYSLGVLLYELLVGSTPFDAKELMASGIDAMRKTIREQEPERPSTKLATLPGEQVTTTAKRRSVEASRLVHLLRGDLDWIVMKCLEKDRSRRYETANGLAADLKRHLHNEPVVARPPSASYRFQKAFRRNKLAFGAAGAVAAALLLGLVVSESMYVRESQARGRAVSADREKGVALAVAQTARRDEAEQRQRARAQELAARRTAYASDINLIQQALAVHNLGRAVELLKRQVPQSEQSVDLRDWEWRYLWQRCQGETRQRLGQTQHSDSALSISSDGKWLAMEGSSDAQGVSLWDLTQQREVTHPELRGPVGSMAFSPREPLLAYSTDASAGSTNAEYVVQFWNGATRKRLLTRLRLDGPCSGLAYASDGRALATFSTDPEDKITFWKLPEGIRFRSVSVPPGVWGWGGYALAGDLSVAAFTTGGKGIFQATPEVALVDLATGKTRWKRRVAEDYVKALAFSPDATVLVSCGAFAESSIRFWNVATGEEIGRPANEHRRYVTDLAFWPDGKKMVTASADQTIRIWDTSDFHAVRCLGVLRGHQSEVRHIALQSPDNTRLVSSGKDGTLLVWDLRAMAPEDHAPCTTVTNGTDYCVAPDGQSILTLERPGWVDRRLGPGFEKSEPWMAVDTDLSDRESTMFSRDARLLAVGRTNGIVKVWDLEHPGEPRKLTVTPGTFWFWALNPGSMRLLVSYWKGNRLEEWDIATGQQTRSWPCGENIGAISSDGQWCLSWDGAGKATLLDLSSGKAAGRDWSDFLPDYAAFSPDAKLLAVSSGFGSVKLYETTTFREVRKLGGLHMRANSLAFSPNGRRLIAGSIGREAVELWDVESGQELLSLAGQGCFFKEPSLSSDGTVLGASSMSRGWLLHLWRAPSWAEIAAAEGKEKVGW